MTLPRLPRRLLGFLHTCPIERSRLLGITVCLSIMATAAARLGMTSPSAATAEGLPSPPAAMHRPLVAVVKGDQLGPGGDVMAATAEKHLRGVTRALDVVRIPYLLTSDSEIEQDGVPDVALLILPYNRAVGEVELGHLLRFIYDGGKVIACLLGRNDLLYALDVDPQGVRTAAELGILGANIVAADSAITGMPHRVRQPTEYVMACRPLDHADTVAWWATDKARLAPAAILSPQGAFLTSGLTTDHYPETAQLLRALIGHHIPQVWHQSIPSSATHLGPYGPYSNLSALAEVVQRKADAGQDIAPAVAGIAEAMSLLEDVATLKQGGRFEEALQAAQQADTLGSRALWQSFAHVEGEMRGVWAHNYAHPSWDQAAATMRQANLNAVFPYISSGGVAFYHSRVLPRHPTVASQGDWLAQAAAACRKHGIALHPRMLNLTTLFSSEATRNRLKSQGRLAMTHQGRTGTWLCPTNAQNRREQVEVAREIVSNYDVTGLQFDYLRYGYKDTCFCPACRAAFEAQMQRKVAKWPADAYSGNLQRQYGDFRRHQLDTLLAEIVTAVRAAKPEVEISAAVFLNWESHRETFGQDWKKWVDDGLLDFVSPMSYSDKPDTFRDYVRRQSGWVGGKVPLYVGMGVNADNCRFREPYQLMQQIEIARKEGADGWVVFNYCPLFTDQFLPALSMGVTRKPTAYRLRSNR